MELMNNKSEITLAEEYYAEAREKMLGKKYYDAISLIQNAIMILEDSDEYELYRKSLILLGIAYSTIGNFSMSDDAYLKGISWCQHRKLPELLYEFYNNLATSFLNFREAEMALYYFKCAQESNELRKNSNPETYSLWYFLIKLNIMISYLELKRYQEAEGVEQELENYKIQIELPSYMLFSYKIAKAELLAETGRYKESEKLSESLFCEKELFSIYNYYENLGRLCSVFKNLNRLDLWKKALQLSEQYVEKENSIHFELTLTGKWLEYYEYAGEEELYQQTCNRYAKLSVKQQKRWEKEHILFLNKKIEFQISRERFMKNEKKMYIDYLTKAGNREALQRDYETWSSSKEKQVCCIGMIDIDNFKKWNDTYGHLKGDECLRKVANTLIQCIGDCGKVYRFGGDEFLVLISTDKMEQIASIAKNIRERCKRCEEKIALSQGYICWSSDKTMSLADGITKADKQLYSVKKAGRDNYQIKESCSNV